MVPSIVASMVILALVQRVPPPMPRPASPPVHQVTAWPPDSVVTLGGGISHYQPYWGLILPAPGGDLIAYWSKLDTHPFARVTRAAGLVFATLGYYGTSRLGVTVDGLGGVLEAFSWQDVTAGPYQGDIAFLQTSPTGQSEPIHLAHEHTAQYEYLPSAATGPGGGAYIAWPRSSFYFLQRVTGTGTIAAGWNPNGMKIRPPPLGPYGNWGGADPALLSDGSGGVYMLATADSVRLWRVQSDTTMAPGWPGDGVALSTTIYSGGAQPSDLALVAGAAGHTFAVWLEFGDSAPGTSRVAMCSFDGGGKLNGPVVGLGSPMSNDSHPKLLAVHEDGQGGMLVQWQHGQTFPVTVEFVHVLANGTVGPGPVTIPGWSGVVAMGPGGGYWLFWSDAVGMWKQVYAANGTPIAKPWLLEAYDYYDPWPMAAYPDGEGGAYLLSVGARGLVQMRHIVPLDVAGAGPAPRGSGLALAVASNPSRGALRLSVTVSGEEAASIELFDVAGRRLMTQILPAGASVREGRIALPSGLPSGVYLVSLRQGSRAAMRRVAIIQ